VSRSEQLRTMNGATWSAAQPADTETVLGKTPRYCGTQSVPADSRVAGAGLAVTGCVQQASEEMDSESAMDVTGGMGQQFGQPEQLTGQQGHTVSRRRTCRNSSKTAVGKLADAVITGDQQRSWTLETVCDVAATSGGAVTVENSGGVETLSSVTVVAVSATAMTDCCGG
jgi:hypothetical protein